MNGLSKDHSSHVGSTRLRLGAAAALVALVGCASGPTAKPAAAPPTGPTADAVAALSARKWDAYKAALDAGADLGAVVGPYKWTLLHETAANGTVQCLEWALEKKPKDLNDANNLVKLTPLHVVADKVMTPAERVKYAKEGNAKYLEMLKDDPKKDEQYALYASSEKESDYPEPGELAALLLKAGADPNLKDAGLATPLHRAIFKGKATVVKALVDGKAGLEIRHGLSIGGTQFPTPLMLAAMKGDLVIVKTLVEAGADVNAVIDQWKNDKATFTELGLDPELYTAVKTRNTAESLAAKAKRADVAQYLHGLAK